MDQPGSVDVKGLRDIYRSDAAAKAALDHFAGRERSFSETTVEALLNTIMREVPYATRGSVVGLFQELQRLGCGRFIVGRRYNKSRFAWRIDNITVGKAARGDEAAGARLVEGTNEAGAAVSSTPLENGQAVLAQADHDKKAVLEHRFRLRPDFEAVVTLPLDLRPGEAERYATFVRSLPFEHSH